MLQKKNSSKIEPTQKWKRKTCWNPRSIQGRQKIVEDISLLSDFVNPSNNWWGNIIFKADIYSLKNEFYGARFKIKN